MNRPRVVVQGPDGRGLRAITIGGAPAGSAWSQRDLRRQLRRAGLAPDLDLADRALVTWREAGSDVWPDRTRRRRGTIALLSAGLLASMVLLVHIGRVDAFGALTFSGRLTGVLFMLAGAAQGIAAAAVYDHWGKRTLRYSGALVLVGVLITMASQGLLLGVWLQEREYTPYLWIFLPLSLWSLWAGWILWRERAWTGIPHPKSFTAGLTVTALLASANFAYSALYQPQTALFHFVVEAKFGTPRKDPKRPLIHVPVTLRVANDGDVPAYVLNSIYWVQGRESAFDGGRTKLMREEWRTDVESGRDIELHARPTAYRTLSTGVVVHPDSWVYPGADFTTERVVQLPANAGYDQLVAAMSVIILRGDRGKIDPKYRTPVFSWREKTDRFFDCSVVECPDYVMHHARVRHNNNILNVTRRPRYVSSDRWLRETDSGITVWISPFNTKGKLSANVESAERYGVDQYVSGLAVLPFPALPLQAAP
jgi:hypothetical protein